MTAPMNVDEALLVADQTVGFAVLSQSHALLVLAAEVRKQHAEIARLRDHAVVLANTERIVERNRCAAIVQANADASGDWLHTILQSNADAILREPNADIGGIE